MPRVLPSSLPLLFVLGLLAGCASRPAAFLAEESARFSLENTEKFQLLDRTAQAAIACTGLQEGRDPAGRLEVVANLRNRGREAIALEVRCVFMDAAGQPAGEGTSWQSLHLGAGDTEPVCYVAASDLARKFILQVRAAP